MSCLLLVYSFSTDFSEPCFFSRFQKLQFSLSSSICINYFLLDIPLLISSLLAFTSLFPLILYVYVTLYPLQYITLPSFLLYRLGLGLLMADLYHILLPVIKFSIFLEATPNLLIVYQASALLGIQIKFTSCRP